MPTPVFIFGGIALFIGLIIALAIYSERKRTQRLQAIAEEMNFTFVKKGKELLSQLKGFHLFSQGHSHKMSNIMHGRTGGIDVIIFDYTYTTGGGKNSSTFQQTVMRFRSDALQLPEFTLRPEHIFHRIGAAFGYQDIDFDDFPTFSKQYLLRGDDEESIRAFFNERVLTYYEGQKGLSTEGAGDGLIFYRSSKRIAPDKVMPFMEEGFAVFELFKSEG